MYGGKLVLRRYGSGGGIWWGKCERYTLLPVSLEKIAGINPVSEIYYTLKKLRRASYLWWWFDGRWCAVNHQGCHNSKNKYFVGVISGFKLSPLTEKCRLSYADTKLLPNLSKKPGLFPPINEPSHLFCLWTRPYVTNQWKNTSYKLYVALGSNALVSLVFAKLKNHISKN